ncbi:hypothetical protein ACP4OV_014067 [Aristida adscensionis]
METRPLARYKKRSLELALVMFGRASKPAPKHLLLGFSGYGFSRNSL